MSFRLLAESTIQVAKLHFVDDSHLIDKRDIVICDALNKSRVRIEEHDMEVLHRMDALQTTPILEPDDVLRW